MKTITVAASVLTLALLLVALAGIAQQVPSLSPLSGDVEVTSSFGKKNHPSKEGKIMHHGIDLKAKTGTEVLATATGIIAHAGENSEKEGYGIYITVQHGEEYHTLYAHLSEVTVQPGQKVEQGDLIGYTGNTGYSKGPHLHYEVVKNGRKVNPAEYFEL